MGRPVRLGPPAPNRFVGVVSREELAWAAGFFDGEGCTTVHTVTRSNKQGGPKTYQYLKMSLHQVDHDHIIRFHKAIGSLGVINGPYGGPNRISPIYQWSSTTFENAQAVAALLWTFWTGAKREQYKRALKTVKQNPYFLLSKSEKQSICSNQRWEQFRNAERL